MKCGIRASNVNGHIYQTGAEYYKTTSAEKY